MNELQYVVSMLQDCNKAAVANAVGLSARTVRDVAAGKQAHPSYETIRKLAEYFKEKAK
jgi:transcriptional regulator with XRE-family HTH domain